MYPAKDLLRPPSIQGGMRQRGDSCAEDLYYRTECWEAASQQGSWPLEYLSGKMQLLQAGWGEWGHKDLATVLGDAPTSIGINFLYHWSAQLGQRHRVWPGRSKWSC